MVESAFKTTIFWYKFKWERECSVLQNIKKKNQWESMVISKPHFLFFEDQSKDICLNLLLRQLHSGTNLNEI